MKPKKILRISILVLAILIVSFFGFAKYMNDQFTMNEKEISEFFSPLPVKLERKIYTANGRDIHFAQTGSDTLPLILFLHGAPGSWDAFATYLADTALAMHAHCISVDRPGYGRSGKGKSETSIQRQAELFRPLLDVNKSGKKAIVVGHSFGGPIAARLAMDYPDRIQAVVMIAPAIDPQNEKIWRISYPANRKIFRWMVPADWRATNDEKLSHVTELNLMLPLWKYIMCPVIFMYGKKDKIVPVANATFIQQVVEKEKLEILSWENEGHFIVWSEKDSIVQKLRQLLPR